MKEEWADIKGFEGVYQVSNFGRVKSSARRVTYPNGISRIQKERLMSLKPNVDNGYVRVNFYINRTPTPALVHRLVAEYFVDNPDPVNKIHVNHKDGNRSNNHYKNLEWLTHQENLQHAVDTGLYKCKGGDNHMAKAVVNCRGEVFDTISQACKAYGLSSRSGISKVCQGERVHAGKYEDNTGIKWKYYKD